MRVKFNLNDYILAKLTDEGREAYRDSCIQFRREHPQVKTSPPDLVEDEEGYSRWQAWLFIERFGHDLERFVEGMSIFVEPDEDPVEGTWFDGVKFGASAACVVLIFIAILVASCLGGQ